MPGADTQTFGPALKEVASVPAVSKVQRQAAAIAEHAPGKLYARNRGLAKMSKGDLHKFASTKESGLPARRPGPLERYAARGR